MLFEFSMAFQLTGAIILLLWSFGKVNKNAIEMCFPGIVAVDTDSEGNGILKKDVLQKNVEKIFLNVFAFLCIVSGYIMNVFAFNDMKNQIKKAVTIALITALLIYIGYKGAQYMAKAWFKTDVKISPKDMKEINVLSSVSEKDILDLFKK